MKALVNILIYLLLPFSILLYSCKKDNIPALSTSAITNILGTAAISGGSITNDGTSSIMVRGVCWSTNANPTTADSKTMDGAGTGIFESKMTDLNLSTTYYVRAYATNNMGTAYGNEMSFRTSVINFNPDLTYGSVTDIEGNIYKTIQIGTQTWMVENLKTSKYNDGSQIPDISDSTEWANSMKFTIDSLTGSRIYQGKGSFCWYNNNLSAEENGYGKLYDYFAVETGKLCPTGWHVPAFAEWSLFGDPFSLNVGDIIGSELMETGTTHWNRPDLPGTNETGFTALPGGVRTSGSTFSSMNIRCEFWTSDESQGYKGNAWYFPVPITWNYAETPSNSLRTINAGLSVRCVKDF